MSRRTLSTFTYANHVALIRGGREFFELLISLVQRAEKKIYFQIYIFDDDDTGQAVARELMLAARRGVEVHMLVDAYASQGLSGFFVRELKDAGIHFRWFKSSFKNKRFYFGRRLHHKVVVVDSVKSLVCGLNVSNRYNDTPDSVAWLDWALYTEGTASVKLEQVCKHRIKDYSRTIVPVEEVEKGNKCAVRVCVNDWIARRSEVTRSYLEMMDSATTSVIIMSPYFMPGYKFRRALKKAVKRGIRFQIILTGISDIFIAKWAERYLYDWLLGLGVEIHEYQTNVLHGKIVVCDRQCVSVGSYNVNNLSAYASIELNMEVRNAEFAAHAEEQLSTIIKNECRQITKMVHASKTNFLQRMIRGLAYNFLRLCLFLFAFKHWE